MENKKFQWIDKTGYDAQNPSTVHTNPTIVKDVKLIQKELFTAWSEQMAFEDFNYYSLFSQILQSNLVTGMLLPDFRPGQTINITVPVDVLGDFVDSECSDWTYDTDGYIMGQLAGGDYYRFGLEKCSPCPANNCGTDAYDLDAISLNTAKANRAFAKSLDYAIFTGKDIKTGQKRAGFVSFMDGAKASPYIAESTNSVQDLELTLIGLQEQYENYSYDYTTGAAGTPGQAGYEYSRTNTLFARTPQDFVIFVSHAMANKLKSHPAINNQIAGQINTLAAGYTTRQLGSWDGMYPMYEVSKALIGGNDAVIFDKKSYIVRLMCEFEAYMGTGHDYKNPKKERYAKQWVFYAGRIDFLGNHTLTIPARSLSDQTLMYKTPVNVQGTPNVSATINNPADNPVNVKTVTTP